MSAKAVLFLLILSQCRPLQAQDYLEYATYFGGPFGESSRFVKSDSFGNIYVSGLTQSAGVPFEAGPSEFAASRVFLAKFSSAGTRLWAEKLPVADVAAIDVSPGGDIVLTGRSIPGLLPVTPGALQPTQISGLYIVKMDQQGQIKWATYFGNFGALTASAVALSAQGRVALCGNGRLDEVPRLPGAPTEATPNGFVAFCIVIRADGTALEFSSGIRKNGASFANSVRFAGEDKIAVTGGGLDLELDSTGADPRRSLFRLNANTGAWEALGDASFGVVSAISFSGGKLFWDGLNGLNQSSDGAQSWTTTTRGGAPLIVHPLNPQFICALTPYPTCSKDGGISWRLITLDNSTYLVADPLLEGVFYFSSTRSLNSIALNDNVPAPTLTTPFQVSGNITCLLAESDGSSTTLYVCGFTRFLFRSKDGGASWQQVAGNTNLSRLVRAPGDPNWFYATRARYDDGQNLIRRSRDGGETWQEVGPELDRLPGALLSLLVDPRDPSRVVLATSGGLWLSEDGAETWRSLLPGLPNRDLQCAAFSPEGDLYLGSYGRSVPYAGVLDWQKSAWEQIREFPSAGGAYLTSLEPDGNKGWWVLGESPAVLAFTAGELLALPERPSQGLLLHLDSNLEVMEARNLGEIARQLSIDAAGRIMLYFPSSYNGLSVPRDYTQFGEAKYPRDGFVLAYTGGANNSLYWLPGTQAWSFPSVAFGPDSRLAFVGSGRDSTSPATNNAEQMKPAGEEDLWIARYRLP